MLPHRTIAVIILQINVVFRLLNSDVYQPIDRYDGMGFVLFDSYYWQMEKFVNSIFITHTGTLYYSTIRNFFFPVPPPIGMVLNRSRICMQWDKSYRSHYMCTHE